jgi:antitoxin MazE
MIKSEPRQGWDEAAMEMQAAGEDQPLIEDEGTSFDQEEWTW